MCNYTELDGSILICHLVKVAADEAAKKIKAEDDLEKSSCLLIEKLVSEIRIFAESFQSLQKLVNALEMSRDIVLHVLAAIEETCSDIPGIQETISKESKDSSPSSESEARSSRTFESLPSELIAQIFDFGTYKTADALRLSGINRRCREIALQTPSLWTRIDSESCLEVVKISIERASRLNFSVVLRGGPNIDKFLDTIKNYHHRISSVYLEGDESIRNLVEGFDGFALDQLTVLEMSPEPRDHEALLKLLALHLPNLRRFSGGFYIRQVTDPAPSWLNGLTSCSLSLYVLPDMYALNLPNCEHLELDFRCLFYTTVYNLPKLQHLSLDMRGRFMSSTVVSIIDRYIPTNQLQTLEIKLAEADPEEFILRGALQYLPFQNLVSFKISYEKRKGRSRNFLGIKHAPLLEHFEATGVDGFMLQECIQMVKSYPLLRTLAIRDCDDRKVNGILELAKSFIDSPQYANFRRLCINGCQISPMQSFRLRHLRSRKIYAD